MNNLSKELTGASSIPIILSVISKKEAYGYEIIQEIKKLSKGRLTFAEGTLYPVLHKLEKKRLIKSKWKKSKSGRERKYYKICTHGEKFLSEEKENWIFINNLITKLWNIEMKMIYSFKFVDGKLNY